MTHFLLALLLSALTGFLSLSQELLWFRAISFATAGSPQVFGHVLGFFLIGIAFGALLAQRVLTRRKIEPYHYIALLLLLASLVYFCSVPLIGHLYTLSPHAGALATYLLVALVSLLMGGIFPVLCHTGVQSDESQMVGFSVSWIYLANIIGSTTGPLLTGFVLMDHFTFQELILYASLISLALSGLVILFASSSLRKPLLLVGTAFAAILLLLSHDTLYQQVLDRLQFKTSYFRQKPFLTTLQNRSGIITVSRSRKDILYGHGIYDGRFNTNPYTNENGIRRAYMIAALHPNPKRVLEIGLGSGSWAWVLASYQKVKHLTVIEINPGYPQIIKRYPDIASFFKKKKVHLYYDDGRRWLVRHPGARFDFILMNTTYHWRGNNTNLLSVEFLRLCKAHLRRGGVIYYNTTSLKDIPYTAARVFRHVTRFGNFVAASDSPFRLTHAQKRANFLKFFDNKGRRIFRPGGRLLRKLVGYRLWDRGPRLRRLRNWFVITDDNMSPEYKFNKKEQRLDPRRSWSELWRRLWSRR